VSSLGEIYVTIRAVDEATPQFEAISSDAARMASAVSSQKMSIQAEDLATAEIHKVAEEAASVKAQVEASPITISFAPVEVPSIPPIDTSPIQESFNQVGASATVMGANVEASAAGFDSLQMHAEATTVSLTSVSRAITSVGFLGNQVVALAGDFGLVDRETSKYLRTIITVITLVAAFARVKAYLTVITTGHTAAVAINTTTEAANASASIASAVAYKIKAAATWICVSAQNALNISHATFLALTGVGIGVIIAAAAAMAIFASQMNAATASVKEYNATAAETPTHVRGIQRAGEEAMYRHGVE
jgi:hypothetical protein